MVREPNSSLGATPQTDHVSAHGVEGAAATLAQRYLAIRERSVALCRPLAIEDYVPQPVVEVSPPKWHLGHTSWFFEAVVLDVWSPGYREFHPRYGYLFNSYYEALGARVARDQRGHLSRPTVDEVLAYRAHVDRAMLVLLETSLTPEAYARIELGLQHEEQHQELLLTDIKYILASNPLAPAYLRAANAMIDPAAEHAAETHEATWHVAPGGLLEFGASHAGFAFDNERPRHKVWLQPYAMRSTLVTNHEYLEFMEAGGYRDPRWWLAEGWAWVQAGNTAPLYWMSEPDGWHHYTLQGKAPLPLAAPVTHLNYYEAAAFCAVAGWRLPREAEWEALAPRLATGRRWEWTQSSYAPYPGFVAEAGAVAEYNGKFMANQLVLRGGSYATPPGHARVTYRNFFHAHLRWQYTGLRPAKEA